MREPRFKRILVDRRMILEILNSRVTGKAPQCISMPEVEELPPGTLVESVHFNISRMAWDIVIWNPSFPIVPDGYEIPPLYEQCVTYRTVLMYQPVDQLKEMMKADRSFAWTWLCNIAACIQDEGVSHEVANRAAARFLKTAFDVDVTDSFEWLSFEEKWLPPLPPEF